MSKLAQKLKDPMHWIKEKSIFMQQNNINASNNFDLNNSNIDDDWNKYIENKIKIIEKNNNDNNNINPNHTFINISYLRSGYVNQSSVIPGL